MSESLIDVSIGARPWLPSDDVELVAEFDRYDFPTAGLLRQGDEYFVFDCFEGHVMRGNVWVYAHVAPEEAERLQTLSGAAFASTFDSLFLNRALMAVLAIDGRVRSGTALNRPTGSVAELGRTLLDELQQGTAVAEDTAKAVHQQLVCA